MNRNLSESLVQEGFSSLRGMVREQTRPDTFGDQPASGGRGLRDRVVDAGRAGIDIGKKGGTRLLDRLMDRFTKQDREMTGPLIRPGMPNLNPGRLGPKPGMPGQRPMTGPLIRPGSGQPIMDKPNSTRPDLSDMRPDGPPPRTPGGLARPRPDMTNAPSMTGPRPMRPRPEYSR